VHPPLRQQVSQLRWLSAGALPPSGKQQQNGFVKGATAALTKDEADEAAIEPFKLVE